MFPYVYNFPAQKMCPILSTNMAGSQKLYQELKELIESLDIDSEKRESFLNQLEEEGPSETLFNEIKDILEHMQDEFIATYGDQLEIAEQISEEFQRQTPSESENSQDVVLEDEPPQEGDENA